MARVDLMQLIEMLHEHPGYQTIEMGVPVEEALSIAFGPGDPLGPGADILEAVDGRELVIRRARDGRVTSIEVT